MKSSTEWNLAFRPTTYWKTTPGKKIIPAGSLPNFECGEVEIARIQMQSTLGDVISLRARREASGRILYQFYDEYPENDIAYEFSPEASSEPLSFGEVVNLLDNARCSEPYEDESRVIWSFIKMNRESGVDDQKQLLTFIRVISPFYPQLIDYFRWRTRQWLAENIRAERAEWRQAQRIEKERLAQLAPFAADIKAVVERETAKHSWSGINAAMGRGIFQQKLRQRLEDLTLDTGKVPSEIPKI